MSEEIAQIGEQAEIVAKPQAEGRKQVEIVLGRSDEQIEQRKERVGEEQAEQGGRRPLRPRVARLNDFGAAH